jgi:hypothetical protein
MAINPNPEVVREIMQEDFGTSVLITSPAADRYLRKARTNTYNKTPENRYSRPCGGKGGFDDFVERWHE